MTWKTAILVCVCVLLAGFLTQALAQEPSETEEEVLTFQVLPNARPETLVLIAQLAEPKRVTTTETVTPEMLVKAEYGTTYKNIETFKTFNREVDIVIPAGTTVTLPAAPQWHFKQRFANPSNLRVLDIACLHMGTCGPTTSRSIERINEAPLHRLEGRTSVVLPYTAEPQSYHVRGMDRDVRSDLLAQIRSDPAVMLAQVT